jgi:hypothetical protein
MVYQVHPPQVENAKKIYEAICRGEMYILFHLMMMGGKTGSYLKAALDLLNDKKIDNVVIISGYSDTALTTQLKRSVEEAIKHYSSDVLSTYQRLTEKIQVYTGHAITKMPPLKDNTLVIHDEPHHAASKINIPYIYCYKKNNIEKALYGDFTQLKKRKITIISVGATSFAEQISNVKETLGWNDDEVFQFNRWVKEQKYVIYGEKGENYYGIKEYLRDDKIIFENNPEKIIPRIENKAEYVIIRTKNFKTSLAVSLPHIAHKNNMDYKCLTGGMGEEVFDFLETKPSKMTLVHICGLCRMGQVLCKTHINCVIETSIIPNIDTVLQALPGRMCGYFIPPNIKIHVPSNTKEYIEKYSKDELWSIDRAMNVKKQKTASKHTDGVNVKDKSGNWWKKTVPIKIPIKYIDLARKHGETWKNTNENHIINALADHPELFDTNPDKDAIIAGFTTAQISGKIRDSEMRTYVERGTIDKFDNASTNNIRECCLFTNLIIDNHTSDIESKGSFGLIGNKDVVYLYGYIQTTKSKITKLPTVKSKSIYVPSIQEDGETIDANGGQIISFPSETSTNLMLFFNEFSEAIERTKKTNSKYIPGIESKISSIYDCGTKQHQGIFLDRIIFTTNIIKIVLFMDKHYSIKISLNKRKGQPSKEFPNEKWFRYSSISWVHTK